MSVSNVALNPGVSQGGWKSSTQQALQDFEQLFQAMQAGSLSAAQQAYTALQQLQPASSAPAQASAADAFPTSSVAAATPNSLSSDWSSLGQALQSGSLTSAQDAFTKLQQDLSAVGEGPHRHHHHELDKAQAIYSAMQAGSATSPATTTSSAGAVSADLSALQQALKSGNTTSAQDILAKLVQDLQTSGQSVAHHHHRGFNPQALAASYSSSSAAMTATPVSSASSSTVNTSA